MGAIEEVKEIIEDIKQHRDELNLKVSLGKLEAKDMWEEAEEKLEKLVSKGKLVAEEADETAKNTAEAAKLLAEEIKKGYDRIRKLL